MLHIPLMLALICGTGLPETHGSTSCSVAQALNKSFSCQYTMIESLARDHSLTCTDAYRTCEGCLTKNTADCLGPVLTLLGYTGDTVKILKTLLFSCTYYAVDPTTINSVVRNELQCDNQFYSNTSGCWSDFRLTLHTNRSDSSLCRKYSLAKSCAVNAIDNHCPKVKGMATKDTKNPFCANNEDPIEEKTNATLPTSTSTTRATSTTSTTSLMSTAASDYPPSRSNCAKEYYFDNAKSCEVDFVNGLDLNLRQSACRITTSEEKLLNCFITNYTHCFDNPSLSEKLAETMLAVTKTLYFFCSIWPRAPNMTLLQPQIVSVVNCSELFFTEVRRCADSANSSKESDNCRRYKEFKSCYKEAFESSCHFTEQISYLKDKFNPFCKNDEERQSSSALMTTPLKNRCKLLVLINLLYLLSQIIQ